MNAKPRHWFAVSVTVTPEYTEAAEFAFNNLDSLGSEVDLLSNKNSGLCTVTAYFSFRPDDGSINHELKKAAGIYGLPEDIDFVVRQTVVHDQDWLAEWKKYWKPVEIGRFIVAAPWHEVNDADKFVIRIEPNMAFGTGTHETTQLCLAAIDENYNAGQSFLDVGTGTGILAIAAALVSNGRERIVAVDIDPDAVAIARTNAKLNGLDHCIEFSTGSLNAAAGRFDVVCANLTADVIVPMLPELINHAGSKLVLSGILAEQEETVLNAVPKDLRSSVTRAGEWIAVIVQTEAREKEGPGGSIT
jgi:ribosomal protein L11 methyltransferase